MPRENAATGVMSFDVVFGGQSRSRFPWRRLDGLVWTSTEALSLEIVVASKAISLLGETTF